MIKQLAVYLLTTSATKRAHITYLLSRHSIAVLGWPAFSGYPELQTDNAIESLRFGAEFLRGRFARPFVVEDTEVKIEAYSHDGSVNYPGFDIKRWWKIITFEEIDLKCRQAGTRRVSQTSTVCLSVPGLKLYFWRNTIRGEIAYERATASDTTQAPWLNSLDFGSIFVPEGAGKPFGSMELAESIRFDFRKRCIDHLAKKIREINTILNLDPSCCSSETARDTSPSPLQLRLFHAPDLDTAEGNEQCS